MFKKIGYIIVPMEFPKIGVRGTRHKVQGVRKAKTIERRAERAKKGYSVSGNQYSVSKNEKRKTKNKSVPELLFLSHLIRSKGVLILIDACSLLRDRGIEFHCTIAGGDAELTKQEVENIVAEKGLSFFISVVGPKHGEEKAEY